MLPHDYVFRRTVAVHMRNVLMAIAVPTLLLAGCASMSESECQGRDWSELGRLDGERGRSAGEFEKHREACARHGIKADEAAYRTAHTDALVHYCTPQGGYVAGRRLDSYADVCARATEQSFLAAFRDGREVGRLIQDLKELQRRMDSLGTEPLTTGNYSPEARTRRRMELMELQREYNSRQDRAERLDERYANKYRVEPLHDLDYRR